MNNYIHYEVSGEIIYPIPKIQLKWVRNFIAHFTDMGLLIHVEIQVLKGPCFLGVQERRCAF